MMHSFSDSVAELDSFSGVAPLFPLPNASLFPHVTLPLLVFEPRYRDLTAHALASERLIAMAVLRPGWETGYETKQVEVHPVVCLGKIVLEERLPDGRYLLLLRGLRRARIIAEPESDEAYRTAQLDLLQDRYPAEPAIHRTRRRQELLDAVSELEPASARTAPLLQQLEAELSLGALCDVLTFALSVRAPVAVQLLAALNVDHRSDLLLDELRRRRREKRAHPPAGFPPGFSKN